MFILLLFYAVLLSMLTFAFDILYFYYFPTCTFCDKVFYNNLGENVPNVLSRCHTHPSFGMTPNFFFFFFF